jgi:hypothetical protein
VPARRWSTRRSRPPSLCRPAPCGRAATHRGVRPAPVRAVARSPRPGWRLRRCRRRRCVGSAQPLFGLRADSRRASARSTERGCTVIPNWSATA